jgi:hypothetical protein
MLTDAIIMAWFVLVRTQYKQFPSLQPFIWIPQKVLCLSYSMLLCSHANLKRSYFVSVCVTYSPYASYVTYESYSESNFRWAVNKTSSEKKLLLTKNMYILKLLLNLITSGIEALIISGNTFFMPVSSAMFWNLTSTPRYCWNVVIATSSAGRWTGVSHSARNQGCKEGGQTTPSWNTPAVLECKQLYADAHCHGGALLVHRIPPFHTLLF